MSCRRGVKDGDCGCCKSLAAKVRELYQRCANAIKSINGINPDGANNFDILPGAGIQVNPRSNGIEIVATGAAPQGMIETINTEGPDADGNFAITAGSGIQINAGTNGIEIENTSQGAVYTGVSPIEVNADNEISLKDWTVYNSTDWSGFVDANKTITEDLLLIVATERHCKTYYLPKGLILTSNNQCQVDIQYSNNPGEWVSANMYNLLASGASTSRYYLKYTNNTSITTPSNFKTQIDAYWTLTKRTATGSTLFQSGSINAAIMVRR